MYKYYLNHDWNKQPPNAPTNTNVGLIIALEQGSLCARKLGCCKGRIKLKNNKIGGTIQRGVDIVKKPCNNLLVVMLSKHGLKF